MVGTSHVAARPRERQVALRLNVCFSDRRRSLRFCCRATTEQDLRPLAFHTPRVECVRQEQFPFCCAELRQQFLSWAWTDVTLLLQHSPSNEQEVEKVMVKLMAGRP